MTSPIERDDKPWWLIDLDGVVWLADELIAGSKEALCDLARKGRRLAFFTNNSFSSRADMVKRLSSLVAPGTFELLSSADAAASLLVAGERAYVLGGRGIDEALGARGVEVVGDRGALGRLDAVVVGLDRELSYERLSRACEGLRGGARLIGTNEDATFPTPSGPKPGAGSLLAAVRAASGVDPVIAGKPHEAAVALVRSRLGLVERMVGDRPSTDGLFASRLGVAFSLVRSGVDEAPTMAMRAPNTVTADLAELVSSIS